MNATASSSTLAPGFADPAHDAQQVFRAVLEATAHPGRIVTVAPALEGPGALSPAATACLLTLADRDTPVWLDPAFDSTEVRGFLRFHAGTPIATQPEAVAFAVLPGSMPDGFERFCVGTDAYPDRSATLIVEVAALQGGPMRRWRGPGIDGSAGVAIAGLADSFERDWAANHALFPCGVDLVFTAGHTLCALPRGIAVES